jgi:glucose/arabinose dehydrogenase
LVTIGDFTTYENAQSDNSYFGKILKINLENKSVKLISKGHRNPQGLTESYEDGFFVSTEHGPRGGDEINIIELNTYNNYGWPLSSKGEHYKQQDYEIYADLAPLNFSHKDFGFVEPIHYFPYHLVGAHGISDIEKNNLKFDESFFVATLNGRVIYEIKINNESQNIEFLNTFKVSERIRDIEYVSNLNKYVILFEETPAIGVLSLKD